MSTHREKEVELRYLSRPTLQQLAKQHNVKANLKSTELVCELLKCWPCRIHSPECMLVQSAGSDDDEFNTSMSAQPASRANNNPPTTASHAPILTSLATTISPPSSPRVSFDLPTLTTSPSPTPDAFQPTTLPTNLPSSHQARRRTWHLAEVQIGDRLLSPFRVERTALLGGGVDGRRTSVRQSVVGLARMEEGVEGDGDGEGVVGVVDRESEGCKKDGGTGLEKLVFEAANVQQTLRFSALTEEDEDVDLADCQPASSMAASTPPACPPWTAGTTASDKSPEFVGFINTNRRAGRPAVRQSIRISSRRQTIASSASSASPATSRRQTMAPAFSSSTASTAAAAAAATNPWPATAGTRPLRPASTITPSHPAQPTRLTAPPASSAARPKPRFDVAASLARPVTWKMHKGPLAERVNGGSGVKADGKALAVERDRGGKEDGRVRQRREMRQKSIDYARNVRLVQRTGQENSALGVRQQQ